MDVIYKTIKATLLTPEDVAIRIERMEQTKLYRLRMPIFSKDLVMATGSKRCRKKFTAQARSGIVDWACVRINNCGRAEFGTHWYKTYGEAKADATRFLKALQGKDVSVTASEKTLWTECDTTIVAVLKSDGTEAEVEVS